jgi:nucleotide-binding universal stress UspA family protein
MTLEIPGWSGRRNDDGDRFENLRVKPRRTDLTPRVRTDGAMESRINPLPSSGLPLHVARRVLVRLDGSAAGRAALDYASQVARENRGCLIMMLISSQAWMCASAWPALSVPPPVLQVEGAEIDWLRAAVNAVADDVAVIHLVSRGPVGPALAREALRHNCDAVVIGRKFGHALPGSVERYLRRHLPLPVIAIRTSHEQAATRIDRARLGRGWVNVA